LGDINLPAIGSKITCNGFSIINIVRNVEKTIPLRGPIEITTSYFPAEGKKEIVCEVVATNFSKKPFGRGHETMTTFADLFFQYLRRKNFLPSLI
jgi:hypothetical protein